LTQREAQVLAMLRRGHTTGTIAERLDIVPVTVRRHIAQVVHKLGVENRSALLGPAPLHHSGAEDGGADDGRSRSYVEPETVIAPEGG
jgi:DNA-binding CsgD family transcriptional regulator